MKNKKKTVKRVIIGIVILGILASLSIYFIYTGSLPGVVATVKNGPNSTQERFVKEGTMPGVSPTLSGTLAQRKKENMAVSLDKSRFSILVTTSGTIEKGSKILHLNVGNSDSNRFSSYFTVNVGNEVICTTALMKPGTYIDEEVISRPLDVGMTEATVRQCVVTGDKKLSCYKTDVVITCS